MVNQGVIAAGGNGTRLGLMTKVISKHLLPVYDKPMIFYPLTTLMSAGCRDILLICRDEDLPQYTKLLGDGSAWGISISYTVQHEASGIGDVINIAQKFIKKQGFWVILGDNFLYGHQLPFRLRSLDLSKNHMFYQTVQNPKRFGVIQWDHDRQPLKIIEKPEVHVSNDAVVGLYYFNQNISYSIRTISERGELEITEYLDQILKSKSPVEFHELGRGIAWFDLGLPSEILKAATLIALIQERQGVDIGNPRDYQHSQKK